MPKRHDDSCEADFGAEGQESPCRCPEIDSCATCGQEIELCGTGKHWHHAEPPATPHFPVFDWMDREAHRASGEVICETCNQPYWRHPQVAKTEVPTLVRACDGRLLKL